MCTCNRIGDESGVCGVSDEFGDSGDSVASVAMLVQVTCDDKKKRNFTLYSDFPKKSKVGSPLICEPVTPCQVLV